MKPIPFADLPRIKPDALLDRAIDPLATRWISPDWKLSQLTSNMGDGVFEKLYRAGWQTLPTMLDSPPALMVKLPQDEFEIYVRGDILGELIVTEGVMSHGWKVIGHVTNPKPDFTKTIIRHAYRAHPPQEWGEPDCILITHGAYKPDEGDFFDKWRWVITELPIGMDTHIPPYYFTQFKSGWVHDTILIVPTHYKGWRGASAMTTYLNWKTGWKNEQTFSMG